MSADAEYAAGPLDGNAAASLLDQVIAFEATIADVTCAGCGTIAPIGKVKLYGGPMGAVLRRPMPLAAPVMRATLPSSCMALLLIR